MRKISLSTKQRVIALYAALATFTGLVFTTSAVCFRGNGHLFAQGGIAYALGLRHGLDADHITAIDNVTRKLISEGQHSTTVGFWFSFGHSMVVVVACLVLFETARALEDSNPTFMKSMDIISACISSSFLIIIGCMNLMVLFQIAQQIKTMRRDKIYQEKSWDEITSKGCISYCAKPLFKLVDRSWKMFYVGIVFGLGFDTTASVAAVTSGALSAGGGTLAVAILMPLLFMAGILFTDSTDGVMMLGTYLWAGVSPVKKAYFNFLITLVSVIAALLIGVVIGMSAIAELGDWEDSPLFIAFTTVNSNFQWLGLALVGLFAMVFLGAYLYYSFGGLAQFEQEVMVLDSDGNVLYKGNERANTDIEKVDIAKLELQDEATRAGDSGTILQEESRETVAI